MTAKNTIKIGKLNNSGLSGKKLRFYTKESFYRLQGQRWVEITPSELVTKEEFNHLKRSATKGWGYEAKVVKNALNKIEALLKKLEAIQ